MRNAISSRMHRLSARDLLSGPVVRQTFVFAEGLVLLRHDKVWPNLYRQLIVWLHISLYVSACLDARSCTPSVRLVQRVCKSCKGLLACELGNLGLASFGHAHLFTVPYNWFRCDPCVEGLVEWALINCEHPDLCHTSATPSKTRLSTNVSEC